MIPLVILLIVLSICSLFCTDHFRNINSLGIKYNAHDVTVPNQLQKPKDLTLREQINSELKSQPLTFQNQIYSSSNYPYLESKYKILQGCTNNNDCLLPTESCNVYDRKNGIGLCQLSNPHTTVFDVKY